MIQLNFYSTYSLIYTCVKFKYSVDFFVLFYKHILVTVTHKDSHIEMSHR
jgi:hypothetical protein